MIESKGFEVNFYGDPSVGIFSSTWTISGDFYFENEEELNMFQSKIIEAFEYASDTPISIWTFEEKEAFLREEEKLWKER